MNPSSTKYMTIFALCSLALGLTGCNEQPPENKATAAQHSNAEPVSQESAGAPLTINPATGLPMVGGVDVQGNPYGTNLSNQGLNPTTGLPMTPGGVDMGGNLYMAPPPPPPPNL